MSNSERKGQLSVFPIELPLPDGRVLSFASHREIATWSERERRVWHDISGKVGNSPQIVGMSIKNIMDFFNRIKIAAEQNLLSTIPQNSLASDLSYILHGHVFVSDDPYVVRIINLIDVNVGSAIGKILLMKMNENIAHNLHPQDAFRVIRYIADGVIDSISPESPECEEPSMSELRDRYSRDLSDMKDKYSDSLDRCRKSLDYINATLSHYEAKMDEKIAEYNEEMIKMRKAFSTEMKLRSSEKYWGFKRKVHEARKGYAEVGFSIVALCGGIGLPILYFKSAIFLQELSSKPVLLAFLLGVPTLIVLWSMRIFAQAMNHNVALADDAGERVAMVHAFKALEFEEHVPSAEREIILKALFRPHEAPKIEDGPPHVVVDAALKALNSKGHG